MSTIDLSRFATEFKKHYTGVRAQQGRVFVDDDHNENERLHDEDERRSLIDIIGPTGSPDSGFQVSSPSVTAGKINFVINPGTLYLGGLRLELEQSESFLLQSDWLELPGQQPAGPPPANQTRFDLVYIEAWQQPVSAVEDSELFEVALGGPDTSVRMRSMRRIHVKSGVTAGDCVQDWPALVAAWHANGWGTLNDDGELLVDTKLKVTFTPGGNPNDLCSPPVSGGYLGAENQAIRVQLVDATHFTWGFDNAAPLYRVQLAPDSSGALKKIVMLTEPKDQAHWPMPGQVVELLPWSGVLSNNEKLAELSGFLAKVDAPYESTTKSFTILTAPPTTPPPGFGKYWTQRSDANVLNTPSHSPFFYLRVWNRGSDMLSPTATPFTKGTSVALGNTGLNITITGNDARPEDFWIIAARPDSPNEVVPWLLDSNRSPTGRAPHGVHRFFTPLGVIKWNGGAGTVVDDCRKPFQPLTRIRSCCTNTVGDGVYSNGQFTKIQDAINALPADGGEVCILPGIYTEAVNISNLKNITIHGCCERTLVKAPQNSTGNGTAPVFTIAQGSTNIRIERLAIEAFGDQPGVLVPSGSNVQGLALKELWVLAGPRTAIEIIDGQDMAIVDCHVLMRSSSGPWAGIFSGADDVLIERNTVKVESGVGGTPATSSGRGGIQLGGGAERVRVINNLIQDGIGNGITLGSLIPSGQQGDTRIWFWVVNAFDPCDPCKPGDVFYERHAGTDAPTYHSAGFLSDIQIKDNRIYDMGLNGIGVIAFFDLAADDEFITVEGLTIVGNDIRHCLQRPLAAVPTRMIDSMGYGGIALADVGHLVIRDNFIVDNGPDHLEPVCGIFVLHGEGIDISGNHILNNGAKTAEPSQKTAKVGRRGGINIVYALAPTVPVVFNKISLPEQSGVPALTLHGNIVSQPLGQALSLVALGPVSVLDNQFTSRGMILNETSPTFIASTVAILNLGLSNEMYLQLMAFAYFGRAQPVTDAAKAKPGLDDLALAQRLANGNVLFNDNQCVLDLIETGTSQSFSSVFIVTLDDIAFVANQCDANLLDDLILSQAMLLGMSVRAANNRFKEGIWNAVLSATTYGLLMNMTSHNQATHCIYADAGSAARLVNTPNTILYGPLGTELSYCERFHQETTYTQTTTPGA